MMTDEHRARALESLAAHRHMRETAEARWGRTMGMALLAGCTLQRVSEVSGETPEEVERLVAEAKTSEPLTPRRTSTSKAAPIASPPPPDFRPEEEPQRLLSFARYLAQSDTPPLRVTVRRLRELGVPEAEIAEAVRPHPVPATDPKDPQVIRERLAKRAESLAGEEERFVEAVVDAVAAGIPAEEVTVLTGGRAAEPLLPGSSLDP